jgi:uncharacterized surface protein with fasciclin (FAS1) repeats
MLGRLTIILAIIAIAAAAPRHGLEYVDISNRKVDFVLRSRKQFNKFKNTLNEVSLGDVLDDVNTDYIVVAPKNSAFQRNGRVQQNTFLNDAALFYAHVAEVPANSFTMENIEAAFRSNSGKGTAYASVLNQVFRESEKDIDLHHTAFTNFVNDVPVEQVLLCQNGIVIVVDALLEVSPITVEETEDFVQLLNSPDDDDGPGPGFEQFFVAIFGRHFTLAGLLVVNEQFLGFQNKIDRYIRDAVGPALDEAVFHKSRNDASLGELLQRVGPKRAHYLMLAPINSAYHARGAKKQLKKAKAFQQYSKFVAQHTCRVNKEAPTRAEILEYALNNGAWSCENLRQETLTFTVNPKGKGDGLEVNGQPVMKSYVELHARNGAILAIDGFVLPEWKNSLAWQRYGQNAL